MTVALVAGEAGAGVRPDGVRTVGEHVTGPGRKKRILKQSALIKIKGNFPKHYVKFRMDRQQRYKKGRFGHVGESHYSKN